MVKLGPVFTRSRWAIWSWVYLLIISSPLLVFLVLWNRRWENDRLTWSCNEDFSLDAVLMDTVLVSNFAGV